MTRGAAAWRGAMAAMLWATATTATVTLVVRASGVRAAEVPSVLVLGVTVFALERGSDALKAAAMYLPVAGLAGALVALLGRRIRSRPWVRAVLLWLAFFPAVGVVAGVVISAAMTIVELSQGHSAPIASLEDLAKELTFGLVGTLFLTPVLAVPLLLAGVTVERWTRSAESRGSALATPAARI